MSKKTINSLFYNTCMVLFSLYPLVCWFLFLLKGGQTGFETYYDATNFGRAMLIGGVNIYTLRDSNFICQFVTMILSPFGSVNQYIKFLLVWFIYIQFFRIIYNLVFFIFGKCHDFMESYVKDNENNLL